LTIVKSFKFTFYQKIVLRKIIEYSKLSHNMQTERQNYVQDVTKIMIFKNLTKGKFFKFAFYQKLVSRKFFEYSKPSQNMQTERQNYIQGVAKIMIF